jgi:hypothetical protein
MRMEASSKAFFRTAKNYIPKDLTLRRENCSKNITILTISIIEKLLQKLS